MTGIGAVLARYRWQRRGFAVLAVATMFAALAEAAALITLVPLIQELVDLADGFSAALGPIEITFNRDVLLAAAATAVIASGLAQALVVFLRARLAAAWQHRLRLRLLAAFRNASWEVQSSDRDGRLVATCASNVNQGAMAVNHIAGLIRGGGGLAIFVIGAIVVDALAAGAVIAVGVALFALTRPVVAASRRTSERLAGLNIAVVEALTTRVGSNLDLRAFGVEDEGDEEFARLVNQSRKVRTRGAFLNGIGPVIYRTAGMALLVVVAGIALSVSNVPVTRLGVVTLLLFRGLGYGQLLQSSIQRLIEVAPYLDGLDTEIGRYEAAVRPDHQVDLERIDRIEVDDISYIPPSRTTPVLAHVSMTVERGAIVGLVGPSGAGKTTLAQLLIGVRAPSRGTVHLGGVDAVAVSPAARRHLIAWVGQDIELLPGTIRENVRFHRPEIDDAAIGDALTRAGLDATVAALPEGLDTIVGSGGRTMSGGQRQRLGIARALAGRPALIVLDEPTSALDIDAEAVIADAIGALRGETTAIVIAHRAATVGRCDRLVALADGRVEFDGPPDRSANASDFAERLLATGHE